MRLGDLFNGRLTWRRLRSLIRHLPTESALVREIDPRAVWTNEAYLLAAAVDSLHVANWQRAGKKSNPKPKPLKRPGDKNRVGSPRTAADFEAAYARALGRIERGEVTWQARG